MDRDGRIEELRYPIGHFEPRTGLGPEELEGLIRELEAFPKEFREAVASLSDEQLDTPYRPGGWTVRQVIHHLPDSHINSYVRFKWTLTEAEPTIKAYDEAAWAELPDGRGDAVQESLSLLAALHTRWASLLRAMNQEDFSRTFRHPESGVVSLERNLQLYVWHGRHHLAHVTRLAEREGW